ncbi:DUF5954 family protein [Streptomyces iconiensis]|uniref:DUF5954 family protein n=1 Tax=Streptomyces iconiensis TaxID=1384038 RepID=A0ABT6ZXH8_9ACTN|nr:DUF5954 family protein [Streptomyces iconiensis]MDJ1133770.1 DUF5954 family protein [Streptomyces iconiensis]
MRDYNELTPPPPPPDHLTIRVTHRDSPVSQVTEMDAFQAGQRYPHIVVRGPLYGVAVQTPADRPRWRLVDDMDNGFPQDARDWLNSHLWLTARDRTEDHRERRRLLAAVARLEKERVDELNVGRDRYRIVRADEFARIGGNALEPPRPTDRPEDDTWDAETEVPSDTTGFVIDHAAEVQLTEGLERLGLREKVYSSPRFPAEVLADSRRALRSHPGLVLLPAAFRVLERLEESWTMFLAQQYPTPQAARRALVDYLTRTVPAVREIPGWKSEFSERDVAVFAKATERFTRQRGAAANELRARGRTFQIVRVERMMRIGPDGPEPPRPSDEDHQEPMKIRPTMDEWGNISYASEEGEEAESETEAETDEGTS